MSRFVPMIVAVTFMLPVAHVSATERQVVNRSEAQDGWLINRFHIKWGIRTRTRQVWDGHLECLQGRILRVTPFIRHEIPHDNMLVGETAWKSTTYTGAEGIYVTVYGPADNRVQVHTATHDFAFRVCDLAVGYSRQELGGDIEITNVTEEVLFRIAGLEKGQAGDGTAVITPAVARANTLGTWTITYTAPEGGLPVGGGIRISWHFTRTWGSPQFTDPEKVNYVTARCTGDAELDYTAEHRGLFEYPFNLGRILVRVLEQPLKAGEQIVVVLGDTSGGSPGFQAPVIAEPRAVIRVEDCTEVEEGVFPVYRRLKELPTVSVQAQMKAHRLFVVAPSLVQAGGSFAAKIVVEDRFRNVMTDFNNRLVLRVGDRVVEKVAMNPGDAGRRIIPGLTLDTAGVYTVDVRTADGTLQGNSNPIKCGDRDPGYLLVWGELHGHTEYSDGYGSADDYFRFARERALLDFAAITDHDVELDAPDYHVADMWREVNTSVRQHHDPPAFCTIPAYEWSPARTTLSTIEPYGDHNIYYEREGMPLFMAGDPDSNTLPKLYRHLEQIRETGVQVIPHVGGAIGNWDFHHSGLENLGEIFSVHGSFEAFGEIALKRGYTIGFVGAADSHNGQVGGFPPGMAMGHYTHGGLTAAIVPTHTRQHLLESFERRRVYATSGPRVFLDFSVNGRSMGEVLETDTTPVVNGEVVGTAPLLLVEVVKNGRVIHTWRNEYDDRPRLTLLWSNRVEESDLLDFDTSLWSKHLRHADWKGGLHADGGGLKLDHACSFDFPKDGILQKSGERVLWNSQTRGDWDGVSVEVGDRSIPLRLTAGQHGHTIHFAELDLGCNPHAWNATDRLLMVRGLPRSRHAVIDFEDQTILKGWNYYYLRVLQADGEMAWSSPVWIRRPK